MSKMDRQKLPHDTIVISDRLVNINIKLRVIAMAAKGLAVDNPDEDAYAISNVILDICEEIDDIAVNCPPMAEETSACHKPMVS